MANKEGQQQGREGGNRGVVITDWNTNNGGRSNSAVLQDEP